MNNATSLLRLRGEKALSDVRVSRRSLYTDETWVFDNANRSKQECKHKLRWNFRLGDGSRMCDAKNAELLESCRRLIYGLLIGKAIRGSVKASSAIGHFQSLRFLLQWMTARGCYRFADLSQSDVNAFTSWTRRNSGRNGKPPSDSTVYARNLILKYVIELGNYIGDACTAQFPEDAAGRCKGDRATPIPHIPDEIAIPLYRDALELVTQYGAMIVQIKNDMAGVFAQARKTKNKSNSNVAVRKMMQERKLEVPIGRGLTACVSTMSQNDFATILRDLNTACYIVIAGFTGPRVSELASLEVNCMRTTSVEGTGTLVLDGSLAKTAVLESDPKTWIAGADTPDNPVRVAIDVLQHLWLEERRKANTRALFINCSRSGVTRLSMTAINSRLKQYARRIPEADGWQISTHQFRKTFARFVARNEEVAVLALKRHFKHVDIQMTLHYIGTDPELFNDVLEARDEYAAEILDGVLNSDRLGGKLGETLVERTSAFRGMAGAEARKAQVDMLMHNTDMLVLPHRYGLCFFRSDTASCQGDRAKVGRDTCIGCKNLVVAPRHRPYWAEHRDQLGEFKSGLPSALATPQRVAAIDSEIAEANKVISIIDGVPQ